MKQSASRTLFQVNNEYFKAYADRDPSHCFLAKSKSKAASNLWADTDEEDNADSLDGDAKNKDEEEHGQSNFTILLVEPWIYDDEDKLYLLKGVFSQEEYDIMQERDIVLTLDDIRFLTSGYTINEDQLDVIVTKLLEVSCRIYLLRTAEGKHHFYQVE